MNYSTSFKVLREYQSLQKRKSMIKTQKCNCIKIFDSNNKSKDQKIIKHLEKSFPEIYNPMQYILRKMKKSSRVRWNNNKSKDQKIIKDLEKSFPQTYNPMQYILRKIKKSSKVRRNRLTLISVSAYFLSTSA